ncbi:hypothetical protein [Anaerococcus sp.]|uniref:hypothetical protein n=1 Tax=Anaerococcus sp. TaxID=1872515 RepID=UPI00258F86A6|nr:hypothetical protein [Anaerococcus sp.]MDU3212188.1 hypothetical protein [Anaerococcus sp.]
MNELKSIYIGRKEQIELIQEILRSMISNVESKRKNEHLSPYKELYFFYGEAGIDKSSLLKMIEMIMKKIKGILTILDNFGHSITGITKTFIDKIIGDMEDDK